jgi:hypothetical protein
MSVGRRGQRPKPNRERRISVRAIRRDPPDLHKLSRALLALAQAEAEAEAQLARELEEEAVRKESTHDSV